MHHVACPVENEALQRELRNSLAGASRRVPATGLDNFRAMHVRIPGGVPLDMAMNGLGLDVHDDIARPGEANEPSS